MLKSRTALVTPNRLNPVPFGSDPFPFPSRCSGAYARTSTQALNNATNRYLLELANHGAIEAMRRNPALANGLSTFGGKLTSAPVATAHELPYSPLTDIL